MVWDGSYLESLKNVLHHASKTIVLITVQLCVIYLLDHFENWLLWFWLNQIAYSFTTIFIYSWGLKTTDYTRCHTRVLMECSSDILSPSTYFLESIYELIVSYWDFNSIWDLRGHSKLQQPLVYIKLAVLKWQELLNVSEKYCSSLLISLSHTVSVATFNHV